MANGPNDATNPHETGPRKLHEERRSQVRSNTVLSKIEDMTYEILRKHEKQSA